MTQAGHVVRSFNSELFVPFMEAVFKDIDSMFKRVDTACLAHHYYVHGRVIFLLRNIQNTSLSVRTVIMNCAAFWET